MADLETRDALEADLAAHQRRHVGDVTAGTNESLAAEALRLLDKQRAEKKPVAEPAPDRFVHRREVDGKTYTIEKEPDAGPMYRTASEFEANVIRHAQPRIDLLLTKRDEGPLGTPSWHTRTWAALYHKVRSLEARRSGQPDVADLEERIFQQDLYELLEASNQAFGDWRRDAPQKLIIT